MGDAMLQVEFGDELNLFLNFRVIAFLKAVEAAGVRGITEMVPTNRALGVVYDPLTISFARLVEALQRIERDLTVPRALPSRLIKIPVWYHDPWTVECALAHGAPDNMEYLAQLNNTTVEGVIALHSGTDWWVSSVGFQPATYQALPLDPAKAITAPKYPRPRRWTPARVLCLAGQITSFYPVRSPGGYQLLGITPIELFDPQQRYPVFRDSPVLPIVSERHRYIPIDEDTYHELRRAWEAGEYEYDITEEIYRVEEYEANVRRAAELKQRAARDA